MNQPLIESQKLDVATILRKMADHLDRNKESPFGGCAVIIPPSFPETIELLILDSKGDAAQFLATVATRIQNMVTELAVMAKQQQAFGQRY